MSEPTSNNEVKVHVLHLNVKGKATRVASPIHRLTQLEAWVGYRNLLYTCSYNSKGTASICTTITVFLSVLFS